MLNLEPCNSNTVPLTFGAKVVSVLWLGQGLEDRGTVVRIPAEAREFFVLQMLHNISVAQVAPYSGDTDSAVAGGNKG